MSVCLIIRENDDFLKNENKGLPRLYKEKFFGSSYILAEKKLKFFQRSTLLRDGDSWIIFFGLPIFDKELHESHEISRAIDNFDNYIKNSVDGHFSCIAFSSKKSEFYLASDLNCSTPLFYANYNGGWVVCNDYLDIVELLKPKVNPLIFSQVIQLGVPWGSETQYIGINRLMDSEFIHITNFKKLNRNKYWLPSDQEQWKGRLNDQCYRFGELLRESVQNYCDLSNQLSMPISADITAGEDSRLIVAQLENLLTNYSLRVRGFDNSKDIGVAKTIARSLKRSLSIEPYVIADEYDLQSCYSDICLLTRGYGSFFSSLVRYGSNKKYGIREEDSIHLAGVPGGEVFRGTYYLRAKLLLPNSKRSFDRRFFVKLKFLLDTYSNLFLHKDDEIYSNIYRHVDSALEQVSDFPAGIKVDHLLRQFQVVNWGLEVTQPFYLPLATRDITQAIYCINPKYKAKSQLTRSCTENLSPNLAWINTQNNVPTIRKSILRAHLFIPEYIASIKKIKNGINNRLLKKNQRASGLSKHHRVDYYDNLIDHMFSKDVFGGWMGQPDKMATGHLYNRETIIGLFRDLKNKQCRHMQVAGRIINQEILMRLAYEVDSN